MSTATQPLAVPRIGFTALARDYSVLVKARVTTLIILTTWCGAYFAAAGRALLPCRGPCSMRCSASDS